MKNFLSLSLFCVCVPSLAYAGSHWKIDSQEEWLAACEEKKNLEITKGYVKPQKESGVFRSKIKTFSNKTSAQKVVVGQSPLWQNWKAVENVGPKNLGDAPVLLAVGPNNYWMFGRYMDRVNPGRGAKKKKQNTNKEMKAKAFVPQKAKVEGFDIPLQTSPFEDQYDAPGAKEKKTKGYHAWQSRDMKTWIHHGAVTEAFSRWVTTAEYVDGKFYIYYDYPNDQDPHLYIDDDLTDGKPGKNMGLAFADPSHGSDCAMIRDLEGKFHVIYEDWTPILARTHSWDSPLAGHAISDNGMMDFKILKPAVDKRTQSTGKIGTYLHPHWTQHPDWKSNVAEYVIHKPEQEAFGDWAAISIGGQYYLFGDYDPVGKHQMSVGWFTSGSLDKPFEWCDHIGKGHPDPDIAFAEGQFYLVTQQNTDYVSPGPWVEEVSIRVGVDKNNNGKIDEWTDWSLIKEHYAHHKSLAKQVLKTDASLDLSDLPEGYGFQFEIKLKDTTKNKSKPILDQLMLVLK